MSLRDKLIPYTVEAIQKLGGRGRLWQIRRETIKILDREGKLSYLSLKSTEPKHRLYQQRWTLELLKERGVLENGDGFWKLKENPNIFDLVG